MKYITTSDVENVSDNRIKFCFFVQEKDKTDVRLNSSIIFIVKYMYKIKFSHVIDY